jgi:virginiamycin B lyase
MGFWRGTPDGALWFTESFFFGSKIGRITTTGAITEFVVRAGSEPENITAGPDGALWFTEFNSGQIGRITTNGTVTEFGPVDGITPFGITTGPDRALWFTAANGNMIARITTGGTSTVFPIPEDCGPEEYCYTPYDITAGPDGALWFSETHVLGVNESIGRITTDGTITGFAIPSASSGPRGITAGPDGALWFTESSANQIGRIPTDPP